MRRLQRAELLDDQEPEDDDRTVGIQEILQPLPQAHAAQRSEISFEFQVSRFECYENSKLETRNLKLHSGA
jgi:hypothetical protein